MPSLFAKVTKELIPLEWMDFSRSQDTRGIEVLISILPLNTEMAVPSGGGKREG